MFNTITVKIFPSPFIYIHLLILYYHQVKVTSFAHRQLNTVKTKQSKFKRKLLCKSLNSQASDGQPCLPPTPHYSQGLANIALPSYVRLSALLATVIVVLTESQNKSNIFIPLIILDDIGIVKCYDLKELNKSSYLLLFIIHFETLASFFSQ